MTTSPSLTLPEESDAACDDELADSEPADSEPAVRQSYEVFYSGALPVAVNIACFEGASGLWEYHIAVFPMLDGNPQEQLQGVLSGYKAALLSCNISEDTALFRRFFCRDLAAQAEELRAHAVSSRENDSPCAVSWIEQPPAPQEHVALWAYHCAEHGTQGALQKQRSGATLTWRRGELAHHWTTGLHCPQGGTSFEQTQDVLAQYEAILQERHLTLADNVVRTWFFVRDIDDNYGGLVVARRQLFEQRGLTADTHYIASTGIEGRHINPAANTTLDAYAVSGVRPEQIAYLASPENLCPTSRYGVTFERGTAVAYRDRTQIYISGTASIDDSGAIVHVSDVSRQIDRTLDNVEALLAQADATFSDVGIFIAYIREAADYPAAWTKMRQRCGDAPLIVVTAPVCRPHWLFEVECIATVPADNPHLPEW